MLYKRLVLVLKQDDNTRLRLGGISGCDTISRSHGLCHLNLFPHNRIKELSLLINVLLRLGGGMRPYLYIALSRPFENGVLVCFV